jgi:hypothetical protein
VPASSSFLQDARADIAACGMSRCLTPGQVICAMTSDASATVSGHVDSVNGTEVDDTATLDSTTAAIR